MRTLISHHDPEIKVNHLPCLEPPRDSQYGLYKDSPRFAHLSLSQCLCLFDTGPLPCPSDDPTTEALPREINMVIRPSNEPLNRALRKTITEPVLYPHFWVKKIRDLFLLFWKSASNHFENLAKVTCAQSHNCTIV